MIKNVYEILNEVAEAKNDQDRKAILYYNNNYALRQILKATFDPNIKFVINRVPKYRPNDAPPGLSESTLHKEVTRLYLFEEGNPSVSPNLTQERKEQLLIQILESIEAKEAVVLSNALLKNLRIKGLTKKIVEEVFPDLL
jgi:hypothetical protein